MDSETASANTSLASLTALQRDVLLVVQRHNGEAGPTLVPAIQSFLDHEAADATVYDNLGKLVDRGYVKRIPEGRSRRYLLTQQGSAAATRIIDRVEAMSE